MKNIFLIGLSLLLITGSFTSCDEDDEETLVGNWVERSDFEGVTRSSSVSFVIDDVAYVGTGYNSEEEEFYSDFWTYDADLDFWKNIAEFPGDARSSAVAFSVTGKGYVGTGFNGDDELNDFWEYNPGTNEWRQIADYPGTPRYAAVAFSVAGFGYVGTGYDGNDTKDFYQYNPESDSWSQIPSIGGSKRKNALSLVYGDRAFITTGIHNGSYEQDIWEFDPTLLETSTSPWIEKNALNIDDYEDYSIRREGAVAFVLNNGIAYIATGKDGYYLNSVFEYDIVHDLWDQKTSFEGTSRVDAVSFVLNNRPYVALGRNSSLYMDDIWEFEPNEDYDEDD